MTYYVIDSFGRSYIDGQTFPTRDAAVAAARRIAEEDRPYGVWIATDNESDRGEEIFAPTIG